MSLQQPTLEQLLHIGKTIETESLGKADEGRRMHIRLVRRLGYGVDRKIIGMIQGIGGNLLEPLAQPLIGRGNGLHHLLVGGGQIGPGLLTVLHGRYHDTSYPIPAGASRWGSGQKMEWIFC